MLLPATSWQTSWLLCKEISYPSLTWQRVIQKGNYCSFGQWYTVFSFTVSWKYIPAEEVPVDRQSTHTTWNTLCRNTETSMIHRSVTCTVYTTLLICVPRLCVSVCVFCSSSPFTLHCIAVSLIVFLGPYLVLLYPFSHLLRERESRLTFSLKGHGGSPHNVQASDSANRNAALPRHLLEILSRFSQRWTV